MLSKEMLSRVSPGVLGRCTRSVSVQFSRRVSSLFSHILSSSSSPLPFSLHSPSFSSSFHSLCHPNLFPSSSSVSHSFLNAHACAFSVLAGNHKSLKLGDLKPLPDSKIKEKRVGRGRGSGIGKTSTRGQNGHLARNGRFAKPRYEGGQVMLWRRSPKHGFKNMNRKPLDTVSADKLAAFVAMGRLDYKNPITIKALYDANIMGKMKFGVKIVGGPQGCSSLQDLGIPLHIEVTHCSANVKEAIEAAGGSIKFIHHTRRGLRGHLKPEKFHPEFVPGAGTPPPKKVNRFLLQTVGKEGFARLQQLKKESALRVVKKM